MVTFYISFGLRVTAMQAFGYVVDGIASLYILDDLVVVSMQFELFTGGYRAFLSS